MLNLLRERKVTDTAGLLETWWRAERGSPAEEEEKTTVRVKRKERAAESTAR